MHGKVIKSERAMAPGSYTLMQLLLQPVSLYSKRSWVPIWVIKCNLLLTNKLKLTGVGAWWVTHSLAMPLTY